MRSPSDPIPDSAPVVVKLADDDGDGDVDELDVPDVPDVAFLHFSNTASRS